MPKAIRITLVILGMLPLAIIAGFVLFSMSCAQQEEFNIIQVQQQQQDALIEQAEHSDIALLFTGSTRGNFEPCGCGGVYRGGLSRRATVIYKIRSLNPNTILVDTGDLTAGGSKIQFEFLAQAYHKLKYDAIAIGEGDMRVGIETLAQMTKKYNLPFVSSNLRFKISTNIPEFRIIKRKGRKIAIISVIARRWLAILPMAIRKQIEFIPPSKAIKQMVAKLKNKCDFIILLSHLGADDREILASKLADIDLWIDNGGHQWARSRTKSYTGKNIFIDRHPPLLISWKNDRKIGIAAIDINSQLTVKRAGLITIEKQILQQNEFLEIYDAYKYAARQAMLSRIYQSELSTTTKSVNFKYVSSATCGKCHQEIFKFWKTTAHAHAFETLVKAHRQDDPNCWACHTTGYRSAGGFINPKLTPELENVGCQTCHKINIRTHLKNAGKMSKRQKRMSLVVRSWHCRRCHVPHRSPNYDYRSYKRAISCKRK